MSATRTRQWRPRHLRFCIALIFCMAALGLSAFRVAQNADAAGSSQATPQKSKPVSLAQAKASSRAAAALEKVKARATSALTSHVARETGHFDFVRANDGGVLTTDNSSASAEQRALGFLREHGGLVGMSDAERASNGANARGVSALKVAKVVKDQIGSSHVKLNQSYEGLPVFGAQLIVHMNDRGISAVSGQFVPDLKISSSPVISAAAANAKALTVQLGGGALSVVKTELSIYNKGLLAGYPSQSLLAYNVEVRAGDMRTQIWIDATKGTVLDQISLTHPALNRIIYTPDYDPTFAVRHEGDPLQGPLPAGTTGANPIDNLYVFAGHQYNVFFSAFGHDSYDGLGHTMDSVLLVNEKCPNAYWNGLTTNYCPDFDADDVVAHEWTHAYTQFTHGLIYSYQSGGLNEAYSDIFGETIDLLNGVDAEGGSNNNDPMPNGQRWQVGDDVPTINAEALGILRDMWEPTRYGNPDKVSSPNYDCAAGAVHNTSGVPGHAFALLVDGSSRKPDGKANGQVIEAIGFTRAAHIYYRAMTMYQTPGSNFAAHEQALMASCNDLIGKPLNGISTESTNQVVSGDVITTGTCQQVAKAMLAVEMSADINARCNYQPILDKNTPPDCPGPTSIFSEDWESGSDGWTKTSAGTSPDWEDDSRSLRDWNLDATLPAGQVGNAMRATNVGLGEPGGGTCAPGGDYSGQFTIDSPTITVPAQAETLKLRFDHYMASEATVDGGQVEISVNGGAFQLLSQESYEFNAPNSAMLGAADGNTNPNAGEFAWNGTDEGTFEGSWGTSVANLSALTNPGDTIKLRFTFSQDGCNGIDGWYVDNIRVYDCPVLEAPVLSMGSDYENPDTNGSFTLSWTRPTGATGPDVLQTATMSCAPLLSDNAESGTGQWSITTEGTVTPGLAWEAVANEKPQHASTAFRARGTNAIANAASFLTLNAPLNIPATGTTFLTFSEWNLNEGDDTVLVEVSTNGTDWTAIYQDNRSELAPDGAVAFATETLTNRSVNLTSFAAQTIRLRFHYQMGAEDRPGSVPLGWYLDDIAVINDSWSNVATVNGTSYTATNVANGTRCYRVRTTYNLGGQTVAGPFSNIVSATVSRTVVEPSCFEDDDSHIAYDNGWHLVNYASASAGHFRMATGNDGQHGATLTFDVANGQTGKLTYHFLKSTKGGTADVYLDGTFRQTIDYKGSVGKLREPEKKSEYQVSFNNLAPGTHVLELRNLRGPVYVDGFCMESSSSSAQPASGPGQTSSNTSTLSLGKSALQSLSLPAGTQAISVIAEASPELPIQLVLIDPSGSVLTMANNSTGVATINRNVSGSGIYTIKVVNVSAGPVKVWTAATPLVRR
ncbi:MAG TPA: M4 family metallopeptidase [Pyrinomonadaceae bacterium]|nr:M4 family metallopeptidase [Pyrinomonadaceae bacterium]